MGGAIIAVAWLLLSVWATMFVMNRNIPRAALRLFFYAIIWFIPFAGAVIAMLVTALGSEHVESSAEDKMFQAIVEKRGKQPPEAPGD